MSKQRVEHERVGAIEYDDAEVLHFPGIPGFPAAHRFVVRAHARGERIAWLVCLDVPSLALAIASPWDFVPDYAPAFGAEALTAVGATSLDDVEIVAVAIVDASGLALNLAAPVLIHRARGRGVQWILEDGAFPLRARVGPAPARASASADAQPEGQTEAQTGARSASAPRRARQIESNPQT